MTTVDVLARLADPVVRNAPYPFLAWLREHEPVHHSTRADIYLISRYADVQQAFRGLGDVFRRPTPDELPQMLRQQSTTLLFDSVAMKNPPAHTRLRRLVARDFTTGRAEDLRERMTKICHRLLEDIAEPLHDGEIVDLYGTTLERFPLRVISDLLGVPQEDSDWLAPHIKATLTALSPTATEAELAKADEVNAVLVDYFIELINKRRRARRNDLISALVASHEDDHDQLTEEEVLGTLWAIWLAGFETSSSAIALGVLTMMENPGQLDYLHGTRAQSTAFVNEVLRYNSPIIFAPLSRIATRPVEIGGVVIPRGGKTHFVYAAANRDPEAFSDPNQFNPSRDVSTHTTFGGGINRCLGAALATTEMSVILAMLRSRYPRLTLAGEVVFAPMVYLRSCQHLPVALIPSQ